MYILSFKLNRKPLETSYFSFIGPILENGNVLSTNLTESDSLKIEKNKKNGQANLYLVLLKLPHTMHLHLSSCLLPADPWISRMCYEYTTPPPPPLLPGQLRQPRQVDLSVTFLFFVQPLHTPVLKVRPVV